ncbi:MAG: hypothetical protein PHT95_05580, partial [Candidatus Omnitrophica bacterium]|nr:hypothetical protein [Candidatus Omnitrophota bacterium]
KAALRSGMFFAGIAPADAFRRSASDIFLSLVPASLTSQHLPAAFVGGRLTVDGHRCFSALSVSY